LAHVKVVESLNLVNFLILVAFGLYLTFHNTKIENSKMDVTRLLTVEDAYFEEQLEMVVSNVLQQVHLLGDGYALKIICFKFVPFILCLCFFRVPNSFSKFYAINVCLLVSTSFM